MPAAMGDGPARRRAADPDRWVAARDVYVPRPDLGANVSTFLAAGEEIPAEHVDAVKAKDRRRVGEDSDTHGIA